MTLKQINETCLEKKHLRDEFAKAALIGITASENRGSFYKEAAVAQHAYRLADAMLAEREKEDTE